MIIAGLLSLGAIVSTVPEDIEEIIVTASRSPESSTRVGSSVARVNRDAAVAPVLVTDLLINRPGVFVQQTTPGQGNLIVRGLKGSAVLNLVDGVRLNNALFRNAPNQYPALIDASWIQAAEVVRGPASVLYGSDALAGAANFLLQAPPLDETGTGMNGVRTGRTRLQLGSASRLKAAEAHWTFATESHSSRENPQVAGLLTLAYRDVGDRRNGSGVRIRPSGFRSRAARTALAGRLGAATHWQVDLQYSEQPNTPRVDELVTGFGQSTPSSSAFFFQPNQRLAVHLQWETRVSHPWIQQFTADVSWQQIDDDRLTQDFGSERVRREENASDLAQLSLSATGVLGEIRYVYGVEAMLDDVASRRLQSESAGEPFVPVPSRFADGSRVSGTGAYAYVRRALGPRAFWSAGLRWSGFNVDLADEGGAVADGTDISGQASIGLPIADRWMWVTNVGRGFRAPNVFDFSNLGERPGNRFNVPNTRLSPETVDSLDTGLRWLSNLGQAQIVVFQLDYDDRITSVETGDVTPSGRRVVQSQNVAESRVRGIELSGGYLLGGVWRVDGALNYTRGTDRSVGAAPTPGDRIPPLNGRISLSRAVSDSWEAQAYLLFASRQDRLSPRDVGDPRIDPRGTPGWATVNLRATYKAQDRWRVDVALENVFDRAYRHHGSGIDAEGINLLLSFERSF